MSLDFSLTATRPTTVYECNITHNLTLMADKAGIYQHLWRPAELHITHAAQLIEPLEKALTDLRARPTYFQQFNPPNGWGSYNAFVEVVQDTLAACREFPDATISADR